MYHRSRSDYRKRLSYQFNQACIGPQKKDGKMEKLIKLNEEVFKYYRLIGYTEETDFPNEYRLLVNPKTMEKVRVYHNRYQVTEYK